SVRAEREHLGAALARDVHRAVGRPVVDDQDVHVRQLGFEIGEDRRQVVLLVPGRDEDDGVGAHPTTWASSLLALRRWRLHADAAATSHSTAPTLGGMCATRNSVATPYAP